MEEENKYLQQKQNEFDGQIKRMKQKIQDGVAIFQGFSIIQKLLGELISSSRYAKFIERYQLLALSYLKNVILRFQTALKDSKTKISSSYFFDESLKITNTPYFQFQSCLIELNFINLMSRLHERIQPEQFIDLINSNKLCDIGCLGCNQFYYQFLPIQLNLRKRNYQLILLNNSITNNPIRVNKEVQVYPNHGKKINLLNLQNDAYLLYKIVNVLQNKGGFILIGSKRMQQFATIHNQYPSIQLSAKYMDTYFIMGENINKSNKARIRLGIGSLIEKIKPSVEMGVNIEISFLPVKQSPFKLGFNLEQIKLQEEQLKQRQLHVVLIKVHPTSTKYQIDNQNYELPQNQYMQDFPENEENSQVQQWMKGINEGMNAEDEIRQSCMLTNQISYFDNHKSCTAFDCNSY